MTGYILYALAIIIFSLYCLAKWESWRNSIRGWLCKLPEHTPRLRFKQLRLHYTCTHCGYEWAQDRVRGKAGLTQVK